MAAAQDGMSSFWDVPRAELLRRLDLPESVETTGLSSAEAASRLERYGPNAVTTEKRFRGIREFLRFLTNPLVLLLIAAAIVSFALGDRTDSVIIIVIVAISVSLNFYQVFQAQRAVADLRAQVAVMATVVRDGAEREVAIADVVRGDIIKLTAGSLVPADARLLSERDLYVRESALTGESLPVDKDAADLVGGPHGVTDAVDAVFLGTSVQSGIGTAVVVRTGAHTEFGVIAGRLAEREPETEFDRGIRRFGLLLIRVILVLVVFVFAVNVAFHRPPLASLLFALALAVGLTPELLPVIVTVTLSKGARAMARKRVIVKQLAAIENFGSIEYLCSDKTGTLTLGEVTLEQHVDAAGHEDPRVLEMIYLNSYFEAGMKSALDDAVLAHDHPDIGSYRKLDEIPFDFERRRLSVVVVRGDQRTLVTKGAVDDVLKVCTLVRLGERSVPLDADRLKQATATYQRLSADGYRVLAVACRGVEAKEEYAREEEEELTLFGFAAFLDPPKEGVEATLQALAADGVKVVVMTGDNEHVTAKTLREVGLAADKVLVGSQVDALDDAALVVQVEHGASFARVSPEQKNRVITALKARGYVVGYLGDGINDAPSLHAADVGISVVNGVDVARDAANIILLQKELEVLHDGVIEGRASFANIMKYIVMGTSSNFGNMFSMAGASLFLPFLPMLPTQILLNNLLYDTSQIAIPTDHVDKELLRRPRRWNIGFIRQFMLIIGPISSAYDFLTFGTLLYVFHANERLFHTGWFVESLATQTLVVFVIRTAGNPLKSRPSRALTLTVLAIVVVAFILPYTPLGTLFGFTPMPLALAGVIVVFAATYLVLVQVVKTWFYRRHELI